MTKKATTASGTVHTMPADLRRALVSDKQALIAWNDLTSLSRNEWICWVISVQKVETRAKHILRLIEELKAGKRRPCCWVGCIHRKDKPVSPSVQAILERRTKK